MKQKTIERFFEKIVKSRLLPKGTELICFCGYHCVVFKSVQDVFLNEKLTKNYHLEPHSSVLGAIVGSRISIETQFVRGVGDFFEKMKTCIF